MTSASRSSSREFDLDLAGGRGNERVQVADARHRFGLTQPQRPTGGCGHQGLEVGHRQPHGDTRALVDVAALTGQLGERGHQPLHELRHHHRDSATVPIDLTQLVGLVVANAG